MKILQIPYCYYPGPVGGTEVYVEALAAKIGELGHTCVVVAPGKKTEEYFHEGIKVRRYAISEGKCSLVDLYGMRDDKAVLEFAKILDDEKPDIVHMHALTRGASGELINEATKRKIRIVFTYHTPTVSCQRGTLLLFGKEVCDGKVEAKRCAACALNGLGLNTFLSRICSRVSGKIGKVVLNCKAPNFVKIPLGMRRLMDIRKNKFLLLMDKVDAIVAPRKWVKDLLLLNGVSLSKIHLLKQGLCRECNRDDQIPPEKEDNTIRFVYMGRVDKTKGLDIFIKAFKQVDDNNITFDIYGIEQDNAKYFKKIKDLTATDKRIAIKESVQGKDVIKTLAGYDVLVVPSQWMETGPMVVLEAFAAGIPVIGSRLGGIAELIENERNGLLVEPFSIKEWAKTIRRLSDNRNIIAKLKENVTPPNNMTKVACSAIEIYLDVFKK